MIPDRIHLVLAVALTVVAAAPLAGQTPTPRDSEWSEPAWPEGHAAQVLRPETSLLDLPVDRAEYRLGPGDVLELSLVGDINQLHFLRVAPEGSIVIPAVGVVRVLGLDLHEAEDRVRAEVGRYFRTTEVNLTLAALRRFKVFVVGNVAEAGTREATSATRVSELIGMDEMQSMPRNILLLRASGDSVRVDLARFLRTGDLSANPVVREGDVLNVPVPDRFNDVVGSVAFPGRYEHRPGETLAAFLTLVNGGGRLPAHAADTVRVTRFANPSERQVYLFSAADAQGAPGHAFMLQPFDAVYIPHLGDFMRHLTASVRGLVVRPGTYPIEPNVTTVRDLVAMAGGLLPDASLINATLRRAEDAVPEENGQGGLLEAPLESLSSQEQRIRMARLLGDPTNVVVDLRAIQAGGIAGYNQSLQPGDVLTVPRHRNEVVVMGAVGQPGILEHVPGRTLRDYVQLAGGYSSRADRRAVTILRGRLGTEASPSDVGMIEPGDQIIVPYRHHMSVTDRVQFVGGVASTIVGIVVSYVTIRSLFD